MLIDRRCEQGHAEIDAARRFNFRTGRVYEGGGGPAKNRGFSVTSTAFAAFRNSRAVLQKQQLSCGVNGAIGREHSVRAAAGVVIGEAGEDVGCEAM